MGIRERGLSIRLGARQRDRPVELVTEFAPLSVLAVFFAVLLAGSRQFAQSWHLWAAPSQHARAFAAELARERFERCSGGWHASDARLLRRRVSRQDTHALPPDPEPSRACRRRTREVQRQPTSQWRPSRPASCEDPTLPRHRFAERACLTVRLPLRRLPGLRARSYGDPPRTPSCRRASARSLHSASCRARCRPTTPCMWSLRGS